VVVVVADTLGLQNQWGMHKILQFEDCLETKLKTTPREILAIPQSRYYNAVSVLSVCIYFCLNIQSQFLWVLLLQKGDWLAT